jgi:hypothetical protein
MPFAKTDRENTSPRLVLVVILALDFPRGFEKENEDDSGN